MNLIQNKVPSIRCLIIIVFLSFCFGFTHYSYDLSTFEFIYTMRQRDECGMILFLHINKCGGSTVTQWMKKHATRQFSLKYRIMVKNYNETFSTWKKWASKVTKFTHNIRPRMGWSTIEIHNGFPGMLYNKESPRPHLRLAH